MNTLSKDDFRSHFEIDIAEDFSNTPKGKMRKDGPYSAEDFLILLYGIMNEHDNIFLDLDGTRGYGSYFLHEVFSRLNKEDVEKILVISSSSLLLDECKSYNPNIKTKKIEKQLTLIDKIKNIVERVKSIFHKV